MEFGHAPVQTSYQLLGLTDQVAIGTITCEPIRTPGGNDVVDPKRLSARWFRVFGSPYVSGDNPVFRIGLDRAAR